MRNTLDILTSQKNVKNDAKLVMKKFRIFGLFFSIRFELASLGHYGVNLLTRSKKLHHFTAMSKNV